jgi:shikimate dehydrogenase
MTPSLPYAEVIGDPIEHSRSPLIHTFWLQKLGIEGDYRRTRVRRGELPAFLEERRRQLEWRGCNVTMPLKLDALMAADERSDRAVQAGAANLLVPRGDSLLADNTDVGAIRTVVERLAQQRSAAPVTLLGSGGAARGALVAFKQMGIGNVGIHARNRDEREKLADLFGLTCAPRPLEHPVTTAGLINATPLGMTGQPPLDVDISGMPAEGWVFDMVSSPARTPLVDAAERRGLAATGGLAMLVEQAAAAFPLLFGVEPPRSPHTDRELFMKLEA